MNTYYTYILTTWDNRVMYVGVTNDLERRVYEHKSGIKEGFTRRYNIKKLVFFETFANVDEAIKREKEIKGWMRAKKNALVEGTNPNWLDLSIEYTM